MRERWFFVALAAAITFGVAIAQDVRQVGSWTCSLLTDASSFCNGTNAANLTGTLGAARMPALTGDCTTSAGAVATTCTKTGGVAFTPAATAANGQLPGTATNDSASAGNVGEYKANFLSGSTARSATVTITIASPAVVTWTAHPFFASATACTAIKFTTTGALPTGITASTTYWASWIDANTFHISTTSANCIAGTYINTSGTQSGTQTGDIRASLSTGTPVDMAALQLSAGDWDVQGIVYYIGDGTTNVLFAYVEVSTTSAPGIDHVQGQYGSQQYPTSYVPGVNEFTSTPTPVVRFSFSTATTVYLEFDASFTVSTLNAYSGLRARRPR